MKHSLLSLSTLPAAALLCMVAACQSTPAPTTGNAVPLPPQESEVLTQMAEVIHAFGRSREDSVFVKRFGRVGENQLTLLDKPAGLISGDLDADGDADALLPFVLNGKDTTAHYAVFLRGGDSLRLVQVIDRSVGGADLVFTAVDEGGLIWGGETKKGTDYDWTVGYKWTGTELEEYLRSPTPSDPTKL